MARKELSAWDGWKDGAKIAGAESVKGGGSTKTTGTIAGRSEFWQQDMVQEAMPGSSWPQSMECSEVAGECCG